MPRQLQVLPAKRGTNSLEHEITSDSRKQHSGMEGHVMLIFKPSTPRTTALSIYPETLPTSDL